MLCLTALFGCNCCLQLDDPINPILNLKDPLEATKSIGEDEKMLGCVDWCEEAKEGFTTKPTPRLLGNICKKIVFHTTSDVYTEILRDRNNRVISNQQARDRLMETATGKVVFSNSLCAEGLYCATSAQPMIEALIVTQNYQFETGKHFYCEHTKHSFRVSACEPVSAVLLC